MAEINQNRRGIENAFACAIKGMGYGLPLLALIVASLLALLTGERTSVRTPVVLLLAILYLMIPVTTTALVTLQQLIALYLFCIPVNEIMSQSLIISIGNATIDISYDILVLALCLGGYAATWLVNRSHCHSEASRPTVANAWLLACTVIGVHMIVLAFMMKIYYGYGYEHDLAVLGCLGLLVLLFALLWRTSESRLFRICVGIGLATYCVTLLARGS